MATTKKKTFDAVAQSRRWRVQTGRKLRGLTFEQQQELLRRTTEEFFCASAQAPRVRPPLKLFPILAAFNAASDLAGRGVLLWARSRSPGAMAAVGGERAGRCGQGRAA